MIFILSSVIGRHSYGHVDTLFDKQQGIFYMYFSIDRTVHTTAFDKPVVDHWLKRKIAQTAAGSTEKDRSDDRPLQRRARYRLSYIPLPQCRVPFEITIAILMVAIKCTNYLFVKYTESSILFMLDYMWGNTFCIFVLSR